MAMHTWVQPFKCNNRKCCASPGIWSCTWALPPKISLTSVSIAQRDLHTCATFGTTHAAHSHRREAITVLTVGMCSTPKQTWTLTAPFTLVTPYAVVTPYEYGKSFRQSHGLISHQLSHTTLHPYKCELCGKALCVQSGLIIHGWRHLLRVSQGLQWVRLHSGEAPFPCLGCGKMFKYKVSLWRHIETFGHTGDESWGMTVHSFERNVDESFLKSLRLK